MKKPLGIILSLMLLLTGITGCASTKESSKVESTSTTTAINAVSVNYDNDDYYFNWKNSSYKTIGLNGSSATVKGDDLAVQGSVVTISASGVYEITGTLTDGSIIVDVNKDTDKETVFLVLNGATIESQTSAPIYIKGAKKAVILLENGTKNSVAEGSGTIVNADGEPSAAIFSKADLTISGSGTLTVTADYNDGITSKDDLKITDGTLIVNAKTDGIVGKDSLNVKNGSITITAGKDGLRSTNETDEGKGNVVIQNGQFTITAANDAIHAENNLLINNGEITIKNSYESLEGTNITVNGGKLNATSTDDGINVNSNKGVLTITGGEVAINANGDGLDSNGSVTMTGGTVYVDGPTENNNGALDYDGSFTISGGTLVASGSSGMAQAPSTNSQPSILMNYNSTQAAGSTITINDKDGTIVATYTPSKQYNSVAISSPKLSVGSTYTLYSGNTKLVDFTLSNSLTYLSESGVTSKPQNAGPGGGGKAPGQQRPQ